MNKIRVTKRSGLFRQQILLSAAYEISLLIREAAQK
uniref:Uncharacterized protein n=1 Tax=Arundo donax TaxID=35708 RepID=A0A0A9BYG9_ARUDO